MRGGRGWVGKRRCLDSTFHNVATMHVPYSGLPKVYANPSCEVDSEVVWTFASILHLWRTVLQNNLRRVGRTCRAGTWVLQLA